MPVYLPGPTATSPDGRGWNRLSLNAHMADTPDQCGLQPHTYPNLWESMNGRQHWGGYARCPRQGACSTCPVSITHLAAEEPGPQGLDTPLLLARIRPWRQDPNALFGSLTAGRSTVMLTTWPAAGAPIEADWTQIRNWRAARLGRAFRDTEGDAFWLAFDRPGDATARTTRTGGTTEHLLRATATGPQVARLQCPVSCRHQPKELEALAADLGRDHAPATTALPTSIPGIPGVTFEQRDATTIAVRQHAATTLITLANPAGARESAALAAHGVRRTTA